MGQGLKISPPQSDKFQDPLQIRLPGTTASWCRAKRAGIKDILYQLRNKWRGLCFIMKTKTSKVLEQPKPFTPGVTRAMVREYAYRLYRDKLPEHPLTLADWVLAEKDLVATMEAEGVEG